MEERNCQNLILHQLYYSMLCYTSSMPLCSALTFPLCWSIFSSLYSFLCHSAWLPLRGGLRFSHILGFSLMLIFSRQETSQKSSFCSHWEWVRAIKPHTHLQYLVPFSPERGCSGNCFVYIPMHIVTPHSLSLLSNSSFKLPTDCTSYPASKCLLYHLKEK